MINVGVTGTRKLLFPNEYQVTHIYEHILKVRDEENSVQLLHGGCSGVDTWFHSQWINFIQTNTNFSIRIYPGSSFLLFNDIIVQNQQNMTIEKQQSNLTRNKKIVLASDIMLCVPDSLVEKLRSGTWSTIRYCRQTNTPHIIFYPNGVVKQHLYDYNTIIFPTYE